MDMLIYIIIGVATLIVVISLVCAFCCCCRAKKEGKGNQTPGKKGGSPKKK